MNTLNELLEEQLKDLYSAEKQLTKALPLMAKKASAPSLKAAFTDHLSETNEHVARLEQCAQLLGISLKNKVCKAMQGLIEEGSEVIQEKGDPLVLDAALIAAAQRVEHYEISAYGSARALAEQLDLAEVDTLLQETLDEESAADEKLNTISLEEILPEAPSASEGEDSEEVDEEESAEPVLARPVATKKAPAKGK